jgi:hypothetical protein
MKNADLEALIDARIAAALAPKAAPPAPREKPRFFASSVHYSVNWFVKAPADQTGWSDPRQKFQSGYDPDAQHLGLGKAIEIGRKCAEKNHLPVKIVPWDGTPGILDQDTVLIVQQLHAKGSDSPLNEVLIKAWHYSGEPPKSLSDDLDTLRKKFNQ